MTDKQIIIDGVDVSGCKCFYINASHPERKEYINPYCKDLCKDNTNCYYKQLKHKEQKNYELKQTLAEIKEIAKEAGNTQYLTFPDFDLKQNAKMLMGQFNGYLQQILQKISECEVEND